MAFISNILLLIYFVLLCVGVYKSAFFSSKQISKRTIILLLCAKLIAGFIYVYAHQQHIDGGDIFQYFADGNLMFQQLYHNPKDFFFLLFSSGNKNIAVPTHLEEVTHQIYYWGGSNFYLLVRFNALVRLISMGNIYIHSLFASFIAFIGCFYVLKTFEENIFTNKWVLYSIFLTPSILFWTAGIHKEFVAVFALGLMLYSFFNLLKKEKIKRSVLLFSLGFVLLAIVRDYMLLALIPSFVFYGLFKILKNYKVALLLSVLALLFCGQFVAFPQYNYQTGVDLILDKRQQFASLENGNTAIALNPIENNVWSLAQNAPNALFNTIARPHFFDMQNAFTVLAGIESFLLSILFVVAIVSLFFYKIKYKAFIVFMLLFSILLLLIIGWIVPNIGAILRYRSIALVVFVPVLLQAAFQNPLLYRIINAKGKKIA